MIIWMAFLVTVLTLFIFPVGPVIYLRINSIKSFLGKRVSLLLAISLNGMLGVTSQNIQSVFQSLRVSVIPSSVVIVYVTLQLDMLPPTLLH